MRAIGNCRAGSPTHKAAWHRGKSVTAVNWGVTPLQLPETQLFKRKTFFFLKKGLLITNIKNKLLVFHGALLLIKDRGGGDLGHFTCFIIFQIPPLTQIIAGPQDYVSFCFLGTQNRTKTSLPATEITEDRRAHFHPLPGPPQRLAPHLPLTS